MFYINVELSTRTLADQAKQLVVVVVAFVVRPIHEIKTNKQLHHYYYFLIKNVCL